MDQRGPTRAILIPPADPCVVKATAEWEDERGRSMLYSTKGSEVLNKIREGDIVVADIVGRRMTVDEVTESSALHLARR